MATQPIENLGDINQSADDDEIRLLMEVDDSKPPEKTAQPPAPSPELSNEDHDEDDDQIIKNDEELEGAADEAAREEIRARRREERKNKKERLREQREQQERTNRALAAKVADLERQIASVQNVTTGTQLAALDKEINNVAAQYHAARERLADATTKGDGAAVVEATETMFAARQRAEQLAAFKERATKQETRQPNANPLLIANAKAFLDKHKWYGGPQSTDLDSRMLKVIDDSVAADGFDPTTPTYWEELENRARKTLPHRFTSATPAAAAATKRPPRSPVGGGSGDAGNGGKGVDYALSADRVKAMKDAGIWNDPEKRKRMIQRYKDADKAAAQQK